MINLRILGIAILVASIGFTHGIQNVFAFAGYFIAADIDVDEGAMSGNNTTDMTMGNMNETESQNMTGSMMNNSTS